MKVLEVFDSLAQAPLLACGDINQTLRAVYFIRYCLQSLVEQSYRGDLVLSLECYHRLKETWMPSSAPQGVGLLCECLNKNRRSLNFKTFINQFQHICIS